MRKINLLLSTLLAIILTGCSNVDSDIIPSELKEPTGAMREVNFNLSGFSTGDYPMPKANAEDAGIYSVGYYVYKYDETTDEYGLCLNESLVKMKVYSREPLDGQLPLGEAIKDTLPEGKYHIVIKATDVKPKESYPYHYENYVPRFFMNGTYDLQLYTMTILTNALQDGEYPTSNIFFKSFAFEVKEDNFSKDVELERLVGGFEFIFNDAGSIPSNLKSFAFELYNVSHTFTLKNSEQITHDGRGSDMLTHSGKYEIATTPNLLTLLKQSDTTPVPNVLDDAKHRYFLSLPNKDAIIVHYNENNGIIFSYRPYIKFILTYDDDTEYEKIVYLPEIKSNVITRLTGNLFSPSKESEGGFNLSYKTEWSDNVEEVIFD